METLTNTVSIIDVFETTTKDREEFFKDTPYSLELNLLAATERGQVGLLWHEGGRNRILLAPENVVVKTSSGHVREFATRQELQRVYGLPKGDR